MSNENKNTLEEYIAPAKTAEEIRAERAAAAAAKARAEAEEAARLEAEKLARIQAEEAAKRAEEERLAREQSVRDALKHFGEEVDHDAVQARRQARIQERRRIEAELQAEAQANAISPRERKKLEKKAAKGDEVARAQILAADAVQKKARERLAEFDRLNGTSPYDTRPFATVTDGMTFEEPKKKKKVWRKVLAAILALLIIAGTVLGVFIYRKLNMICSNVDEYTGVEEILENDIDAAAIDSITDANSLTALMKAWYLNGGEPMQSKNVTNILLIGIDSDSKLSDSMMVLSVNRLAKTLSLVSFYRDSYTYMETATGANAFAKMNAAYYYGGAEMVQDVIEKDYKIKIDDYALVGYDSFPKLVDALGGVDVKVSKKEAEYLNRTWKKWTRTGNKIQFKAGKMHMDGEHALMFARIRKLDSDINRTERQRRVVTAIMTQFKSASLSEVNAAMNAILPEVKTSMKKSQMVNLASDAVAGGWLKYPMTQAVMPPVEYCEEGYAGDQWIWICDYEGAAFELQNMLYGQSNITLAEDRKNALDFSNGKTMTTTRGAYAGNRTYTTRAVQPANNGGGNYTTAYQTTQASSQGGGAWWQTTTQAGGEGTTSGGGANPWWWRQSTTAAPQPTTAAPVNPTPAPAGQ